jgi:hypothetical protein
MQGWSHGKSVLQPAFVASAVPYVFLTVGPTRGNAWLKDIGAYTHGIAAPLQWHHTMNYSDPFFGSSRKSQSRTCGAAS